MERSNEKWGGLLIAGAIGFVVIGLFREDGPHPFSPSLGKAEAPALEQSAPPGGERAQVLARIDGLEASIRRWEGEIPEYQRIANTSSSSVDQAYYGNLASGLARNVAEASSEVLELRHRLGR